jgi:glycosyltransferase involved in cell wall biosynthesis
VPYGALPARLARCGVALGVFGASRKAASVIPNKAHQAMACARPLVTRESAAYPPPKPDEQPGLRFVPPEDPDALASVVAELAASPGALADRGAAARRYFERCFSSDAIRAALAETLEAVRLPHARASGAGSSPASSSPASSS